MAKSSAGNPSAAGTTPHFLLAGANNQRLTKITWAKGIDRQGRPILVPGQEPSPGGTKVCPGLGGGDNWQPTAQTGLYYFNSTDGM
ncbi:MAG: hypothetical protein L0387_26915 [Acidobacteria bacterium]|nr:hypothetical protein [Acidobacteriota bacterium]